MIRDEQRASKIQLARQLAEALDHPGAKDHSCSRLKIKTLHSHKKAQKAQNELIQQRTII
jgi:hypothetical protein